MNSLSHYQLSTRFRFGKHRGNTLEQVVAEDPFYITWCMIHHKDFVIDDESLEAIRKRHPQFNLTTLAEFARELKMTNRYSFPPYYRHIWASLAIRKALSGKD